MSSGSPKALDAGHSLTGRYYDYAEFEKREGKWIIVRRVAFHDWERYDAAHD